MKLKIIKVFSTFDHYGDYDNTALTDGVKNWMEVDDKEYHRISRAVSDANIYVKGDFRYVLIQAKDDNFIDEIQENAMAFVKEIEDRRAKEEKVREDAKAKRAATALVRKQKQLEKLKKELGDNS